MSQDDGFIAKILSLLASLKLTLFIFFTLAGASVIGTLLPQGMEPAELESRFSPAAAMIIERLSLNNLYHSGWFRVLLILLCLNLLACTLDRLPKTVRLLKREEDAFTAEKIARFSLSRTFVTGMTVDKAAPVLQSALEEVFGAARVLKAADSFCAVSEKGWWSRLMVYGVHLSVLVVLAGAIMGSLFGFKGFMNLPEGESSDEVILAGAGGRYIMLPFKIRCDKFDASFYDTGLPKDYRSDLSILEADREVMKESIRVNDPLTYKGVTFYQASYGNILKTAEIVLTDRESGKTMSMIVPFQQVRHIPGTEDVLRISEYQENFMNFGPALGIVIGKGGAENVAGSWILVNRPDFHGNKVHNYQIRVVATERVPYTGLQVKKDPGVLLVWVGFSLMIIGIGLTFYSSHRKIWACVEAGGDRGGSIVAIAGRASRNAQGFEEKFEELARRIEERLPA